MKYRLSIGYRWIDIPSESFIVKMYFIQGIPYTFDELHRVTQNTPKIIMEASENLRYSDEQIYKSSIYLSAEEAHPLMHNLEYSNPECLPQD
jgi:hypothetical protein